MTSSINTQHYTQDESFNFLGYLRVTGVTNLLTLRATLRSMSNQKNHLFDANLCVCARERERKRKGINSKNKALNSIRGHITHFSRKLIE